MLATAVPIAWLMGPSSLGTLLGEGHTYRQPLPRTSHRWSREEDEWMLPCVQGAPKRHSEGSVGTEKGRVILL